MRPSYRSARRILLAAVCTASPSMAIGPIDPVIPAGSITVQLRDLTTGLSNPTDLTASPDGTGRRFVTELTGKVWVVDANGTRLPTPFLDISSTTVSTNGRGMNSIAFPPGFANPLSPGYRKFYSITSEAMGTAPANFGTPGNHQGVLYEWQVDPSNPNVVLPSSKREILRVDIPNNDHNFDDVKFGPDGYAYLSIGDGANSPLFSVNGQNLASFHGKIHRIDVNDTSGNGRYSIPPTNPFVSTPGAIPEIYAYGFRNPWRINFDRSTGDLWAGDVGQISIEEIDKIVAGGNFGWDNKEGSFLYNRNTQHVTVDPNPNPAFINPVAQYDHDEGSAVIGGFIYRGSLLPQLTGKYICGDFRTFGNPNFERARLFYMDPADGIMNELRIGDAMQTLDLGIYILGFGQDDDGELYFTTSTGKAIQLVPEHIGWNNPAGGSWAQKTNWSPGIVPAVESDPFFNLNATYSVSIAAPATVKKLLVQQGDVTFGLTGSTFTATTVDVGGGVLRIAPGANALLKTNTLTLSPGAQLDLADSDLMVRSGSLTSIAALIRQARNDGSWDQDGITSTSARDHASQATTLGAMTGASFRSFYGPSATFDGVAVADTDTLVKYTWYGDTDFSGIVDFDDYVRTDSGYYNSLSGWVNGDCTLDGVVDFDDFVLMDIGYNTQNGTLVDAVNWLTGEDRRSHADLALLKSHYERFGLDYAQAFLAAVPEPAALPAVITSVALIARRARNRTCRCRFSDLHVRTASCR